LTILALLTKFILHLVLPRNFAGTGESLQLALADGAFQTSYYCGPESPKGIVILGTGDGGWSYWEENTAKHLSAMGYAVGGWDCRKFADSRTYDQARLGAGFHAAVEAVRKRSDADESTPVWYGGWSTGAEQSVAAACADRPAHLVGLLLAAPGSHGRYGITTSDLLGKDPEGPGSFALADLAPRLSGVRVAQFAAGLDPMDDVTWLAKLSVPHQIFEMSGKLHDMGGAGPEFQETLDKAIAWTLETQP
jgi:pimeloyl-ACP methyl ester carboxylesterase